VDWRASRRSRVGSERSASQVSQGPATEPVWVRQPRRSAARAGSVTATCPSTTSPCPVVAFVSLLTE